MKKFIVSDIAAWVGAITGLVALTLSVCQYFEAKREFVSLEASRLERDFEGTLSRSLGVVRGPSPWSVSVFWELVVANNSSVPISILKAKINDESANILAPGISVEGFYDSHFERLDLPWNIEAHSGQRILAETLVGSDRELVNHLSGDNPAIGPEVRVRSMSDFAWDCHLSGFDFFGNKVALPWGQPMASKIDRNPKILITIVTARGTTVSARAQWYEEMAPRLWAPRPRPSASERSEGLTR